MATEKNSKSYSADCTSHLQRCLESYYEQQVDTRLATPRSAERTLTDDLLVKFKHVFKDKFPSLPVAELERIGGAFENVSVQNVSDFDVTFALFLQQDVWSLRMANEIVPCLIDGLWLVTRNRKQICPVGSDPMDVFLKGKYLSPSAIKHVVNDVLTLCINDMGLKAYITESGPAVSAIITSSSHESFETPISLDITPYVTFQQDDNPVSLVAKCLPFVKQESDDVPSNSANTNLIKHTKAKVTGSPCCNLWRRSFHKEEKLIQYRDEEMSCRRKTLVIVKSLRYNNAVLSVLNSYQLKTVYYHLCDLQARWRPEDLADRVLEILRELKGWIDRGSLPHYFDKDRDLFADCSRKCLVDVSVWLKYILKSPESKLIQLLKHSK